MAIEHFSFDPTLADCFVRFGYELYRGDTNWIPPLRKDLYPQFLPAFPFYRRPGNCHRHFLASRGKNVIGRISAMVNRDLRDRDGTPVGTIGFFECIDDFAAAQALFDAAVTWLREDCATHRIWGPMNFDIWHGYRLMTRGFDQKLFYGEPYNKPYYQDFFERYGFIPKQHWNSVELSGRTLLEKMIAPGVARYQQFLEKGYRFEHFNTRRFRHELRKLYSVLIPSFRGFLGFSPISCAEFERLFITSRYAFHPRLFTFVYDENNVLSAFAGAFLELSDAIRVMNGKDTLASKQRFLSDHRRINRIIFHMVGITPEEATKRTGLGRAGFYHIIRAILKEGYETVVIALTAKDNTVRGLLSRNAAAAQRQYTLYELNT